LILLQRPSDHTFNNLRTIDMNVRIEPSWGRVLASEFEQPYFHQLTEFVRQEYRQGPCYPPGPDIFAAFDLCPFDQTKVVILGQDPYHEPGQAEGLCFSVKQGVTMPPSLVNIFRDGSVVSGITTRRVPVELSRGLRRMCNVGSPEWQDRQSGIRVRPVCDQEPEGVSAGN
jgi:hypothetical protein